MTKRELAKTYSPKDVESYWYEIWEKNRYFSPNMDESKQAFSIVMPPPNVTGKLHMGHAMDNTMQDILVRFKRLQGYNTLWVPGTDHAGIATQAKVEENLRKEGLSKEKLGREEFLKRCWSWKEEYGGTITKQLRKIGASCDWTKERFTMDEGCSLAVREAFVNLFKKGLIYKGNYVINWCPHCKTTISDIEVEHKENQGKLYHLNYFLEDNSAKLTIATTRPETFFGDTAVAVHPEDERYKNFIGKNVILPIIGKKIPIVADDYVDKDFGTGVVKITPAHDVNDFEVGKRHNLEQVIVMNDDGTMNDLAGPYKNLDRFECRKKLIEDLKETPYLECIEDYTNAVGHCYRCDTVIEPRISEQWFVKMAPLAKPALEVVQNGDIKFVPERFTKIYTGWLENIRDWSISRQLWWGHRIPVWYCDECGEMISEVETPKFCSKCSSTNLRQDEDVLDTWFSSGLWPFEVMGWPNKTKDYTTFYPTSVLVTGRDIIFFWVARMIFDALEFTQKSPFKDVLIHGLVLDELGRKMSKSLGNGIDPLEEIESFGADALRLTLITGTTPGNDVRYRKERIEASRNFTNKLWNATRFALMNLEDYSGGECAYDNLELVDKWILSRLSSVCDTVTKHLDRYELGEAAKAVHDFIWDEVCDWYIEWIKPRLYGNLTEESRFAAQYTLSMVLSKSCVLLHPFMPFITEELWQQLPHEGESIVVTQWPTDLKDFSNKAIEEDITLLIDITRQVRNLRRDMGVSVGKKASLVLIPKDEEKRALLQETEQYLMTIANIEKISYEMTADLETNAISGVVNGNQIYLPIKDLINISDEVVRLEKELKKLDDEIIRIEKKLSNEGFVKKAPETVIATEKDKMAKYVLDKEAVMERYEKFKQLLSN